VRDGALWGAGNGARGSRLARRTPYAGGGMNGRRWIQAGGAAMALTLFAAVLVWFVYDQSSRRIPTAQVVVPESPSAPQRDGEGELLAPYTYTDAAPPAPTPAAPPRPMRWIASPQPAVMTMPGEPPLELERRQGESEQAAAGGIEISSDVVCAVPLAVEAVSPTHFKLRFNREGFNNYFLFKVSGAAGKLVRFDFEQTESTRRERKWWSLNPVYSYVTDLDDPASFVSEPPPAPARPVLAWNGPLLPDTRGQKWHYVPDVWEENGHLCWVMRFEEDHAYVAMRPPYTPGYNERFLKQVAQSPHARVLTIGESKGGRPLRAVEIAGPPGEGDSVKPCLLIYAREHSSEHDSSWVSAGAAEYAASPEGVELRKHLVLVVVPLLDPDAAITGIYESITRTFDTQRASRESNTYARWVQHRAALDKRFDIVLNLHNVESGESGHVYCPAFADPWGRDQLGVALVRHLLHELSSAYDTPWRAPAARASRTRLADWLGVYFGSLSIPLEVNSQAPTRHLTGLELRSIGCRLVLSIGNHVASPQGQLLLSDCAARHRARNERWNIFANRAGHASPLAIEEAAMTLSQIVRR